jgi:dienelactone hydrolase
MLARHSRSFAALALGLWVAGGNAQVTRPFVSTEISPIRDLYVTARDGHEAFGALRIPPGEGPFPVVIVLHPGIEPQPRELPRRGALGSTGERLLEAGYATIWVTYRRRLDDPHALWDVLALLEHVKEMDEVDRDSVVLYGCSGGGDLALDIASEASVAATVVEEGPLILFTGIFGANKGFLLSGDFQTNVFELQRDPQDRLIDELRESTREKISKIDSPILFAEGERGVSRDSWLQNEFVIPELQAADVTVERAIYPGERHCFGMSGDTPGGKPFFDDMHAFFQSHVPTQPKPIKGGIVYEGGGAIIVYE